MLSKFLNYLALPTAFTNFFKKISKKSAKILGIFTAIFSSTLIVTETQAGNGDTAAGDVTDNATLTANDAGGILDNDATAATDFIISGTITVGALGGEDSVTIVENSNAEIFTMTQTGTGVITYAADIDLKAGEADAYVHLVTTASTLKVQGNIVHANAANLTNFVLGVAGGTDLVSTMVIDNATDEVQTFAKLDTIVGVDASDTSILNVTSSLSAAADDTTIIGGILGGSGAAILTQFNVGSTDAETVLAEFIGTAITASDITLGNTGATADTVKLTIDIGSDAALTVAADINAANATDNVTLAIDGFHDATVTMDGDIGTGTNGTLDLISIGSEDTIDVNVIFTGSAVAEAITIGQAGGTADIYTVAFNVSAAETISGAISETNAADVTTVSFTDTNNATAALLTTVSNTVAVDTITIGEATVAGNVKFSDTVTSTILTVDGANGTNEFSTVTFDADVASEVNLDKNTGEAFAVYSGSAAQTQTGIVHAVTADDGKVSVTNTVGTTFTAAVGTGGALGEVEVGATGVAIFNAIVDTKLLDVDGQATFKVKDNVIDDLTFAATSKVYIDDASIVAGDTVWDLNNAMDENSIATGATIYMPINLQKTEAINLFLEVVDSKGALIVGDANVALHDTAIMDYTATLVADDVVVTGVAKSAGTIGTELGVTSNEGAALSEAYTAAISAGDAGAYSAFETIFQAAASDTVDTEIAKQLAPQMDGVAGGTQATQAVTGTVQGIVSNRLASLRSGDAYISGISAGNSLSANSAFLQVFGSEVDQKNVTKSGATVFGYDTESSGMAIGFDGQLSNGSVVGLSVSFSETDVVGKGTGKSNNDVESYTASLYADKATSRGYIEGSLTYGLNENSTSRKVTAGGLNRTYKGTYDSEQLSLSIGGGSPMEVGSGDAYVTPFGSLTGTMIQTDSYTETSSIGSDNLRLAVAQGDVNSVVGTVGVKAHQVTSFGTPMISLALNNEFGDNTITSTNKYQGGGVAFNTTTDVEELSATLGVGYTFGNDMVTLNLGYEAEANDAEYLSQYGTVKLLAKF